MLRRSEIKSFPPNAHWFCPRRYDDDPIEYEEPDEPEEDMSAETKHELIQNGEKRHNIAYKFSIILGLDPELSRELLPAHFNRINKFLTSCDKCARNWHKGRKAYLKQLAELVLVAQALEVG